jgi:hypothetical protein
LGSFSFDAVSSVVADSIASGDAAAFMAALLDFALLLAGFSFADVLASPLASLSSSKGRFFPRDFSTTIGAGGILGDPAGELLGVLIGDISSSRGRIGEPGSIGRIP